MANPGVWFKSDVTDEEDGSESANRVSAPFNATPVSWTEPFRTMANPGVWFKGDFTDEKEGSEHRPWKRLTDRLCCADKLVAIEKGLKPALLNHMETQGRKGRQGSTLFASRHVS